MIRDALELLGNLTRRVVPGIFLLDSKLGDWYRRNPAHKYSPGDVLVLSHNSFGFGGRPVSVVQGYETPADGDGVYKLTMHSDRPTEENVAYTHGDRTSTMEISTSGETVREPVEETHFKWNTEFLFRRAPKGITPDQPETYYTGKRSNW